MDIQVGLAGATGALGREIVTVLDKAPWRPDTLMPLASAGSLTPFVDYGEESLAVDDLQHQVWAELDLVLFAVPAAIALGAARDARAAGARVVDASGALAADPDVPLLVPWINPEAVSHAVAVGAAALPSPGALLLGSVLGPLQRAGIVTGVDATLLLPASEAGRAGMEELSAQVVALFNSSTPPRKVFRDGLAFDLSPIVGDVGEGGQTSLERLVRDQTQRLVGLRPYVTAVRVPVFSGMSASIVVRTDRHIPAELVAQILTDGGVTVVNEPKNRALPRPRSVEQHPFVKAGRVRVDEDGRVHIWAAMDNLRASAAAVVACGGALAKGIQR